jgi:predicted ATP-dependent protease
VICSFGAGLLDRQRDRRAAVGRFGLLRENGRMVFTQRDDKGEPLTAEKALALSHEQRLAIDAAEDELRAEIGRFIDKARVRELQLKERLDELQRRTIKPMLERGLQAIRSAMRKQIKDSVKLGRYLDEVQHEVLENLALFLPADDADEMRAAALIELLSHLRVNVVVDHHADTGAPVIVDDNPVFRSLFGSIEYESENDVLVTDFSRIRAGSLLKAHGGFLMLHLRDLLADPQLWEKLRRFLRSGRLQIEEPGTVYAPISAVSLQPEPVDVDVKIVLIASVEDYYLVQEGDPEFARRFRCKVDFAESFAATDGSRHATATFIAHTCRKTGLPHFAASAVAALIETTHRDAEDQARQSAIFARTEALVVESAALAHERGAALVEAGDVQAAAQARTHRHDYPEQRLQEAIVDGERLLEVTGEAVGQLNGLSVVDLGDYQFGFPVRVTATTHAGDDGLLNIEREVELSGPIHDKGVLILQSHLSALFAHIAPLALNASVVFEQEYSGVEGDSASCAEFYALLSISASSGTTTRPSAAMEPRRDRPAQFAGVRTDAELNEADSATTGDVCTASPPPTACPTPRAACSPASCRSTACSTACPSRPSPRDRAPAGAPRHGGRGLQQHPLRRRGHALPVLAQPDRPLCPRVAERLRPLGPAGRRALRSGRCGRGHHLAAA